MTLKNVFAAVIFATLLAWGGPSLADEYRPDEFLGMDLSKALLSPKPLGPPSKFVPLQLEAKGEGAQASAEPKVESRIVKTKRIEIPRTEVAHTQAEKPRGGASNPDTVISGCPRLSERTFCFPDHSDLTLGEKRDRGGIGYTDGLHACSRHGHLEQGWGRLWRRPARTLMASAGARLLNVFTAQVETMRRLRSGGAQIIRIERVEVSDGGQAVIGNVKATGPTRDG
jgi:hypothetical protein